MEKKSLKVPSKAQRRVLCKESLIMARKCLSENCMLEAELLFMEGIIMLRALIGEENVLPKRQQYSVELRQHEQQLYSIQKHTQCLMNNCKLDARYTLQDGERGHSYTTLFSNYMNDKIYEIHIYEPNMAERCQYKNLINFLEVCGKHCHQLKYVRLFTRRDTRHRKSQMLALKSIASDLLNASIGFSFRCRQGMTERKIVMGNGVIIKTDHGLHIYQPSDNALTMGLCDYDYRKCVQTEVDVWHTMRAFFEPIQKEPTNLGTGDCNG